MERLIDLLGEPENEELQYRAVLPPARSIAQIIAAFANAEGGFLVLGISESPTGINVNGLSEDFRANSVVHKAYDLLTPKPSIRHDYRSYDGKMIYVILAEKSLVPIMFEGKIYKRVGTSNIIQNPEKKHTSQASDTIINSFVQKIYNSKTGGTEAKTKYLDHLQGILNIFDDLKQTLYPLAVNRPTDNPEGKILTRILFSSCADTFEGYLSDLLYEIFLAKPETLKAGESTVLVKDVLNCSDIQEFVVLISKRKVSKLQRGSVKAFLSENEQIGNLKVIDKDKEKKIEEILQIRHLYAHKNGIVDEKFLSFYLGQVSLNDEFSMSIETILNYLGFLVDCSNELDQAAVKKYNLNVAN